MTEEEWKDIWGGKKEKWGDMGEFELDFHSRFGG